MAKKKKNKKTIFESIRKPMPPKGKTFKTRKDELDRKQKHKKKTEGEND